MPVTRSIRLHMLISLSSLFLLAWLVLGMFDFYNGSKVVSGLLDDHLHQTGLVLMGLTLHELAENNGESPLRMEEMLSIIHYRENLGFRIWVRDTLMLASANAPAFDRWQPVGYSNHQFDEPWRVLTMREHVVTLCVGKPQTALADQLAETMVVLLVPLLVTLPTMMLAIWYGVRRGLQPLQQVAREIGQRSSSQLTPMAIEAIPEEIHPLVQALNHLLERLAMAWEAERRFTAHAAHELRTPLASLKVQTQVALKSRDPAQLRRNLRHIEAVADHATRLVSQLLTLARLDPEHAAQFRQTFSPVRVAEALLAEEAAAALHKEIELVFYPQADQPTSGFPAAFAILLRNLVDNAIRYTPPHGQVTVSLQVEPHAMVLRVEDSGPGIPADQREMMFKSFVRGPVQDVQGCGLGLAIVQRIVTLHGGEVRLAEASLGGLRVDVTLPTHHA